MGKIKSAIITALVVAAIVVLTLFATVSCTVPGSNGVKRYNSFISNVKMGASLTGEAYTVLYPEGVMSAADYIFGIPDDADKAQEYKAKYEKRGSLYVEKDRLGDDENAFKANVKKDAEILSDRFGEKGYSSYLVSVVDGFALRISVPTDFTYAAYKSYDSSARSEATGKISRTVQYLTADGELTLRNSEVGKGNDKLLTPVNGNVSDYFKSFKEYSSGKRYAVKVNLTKEGKELIKSATANIVANASSDKAIGFYVGDTQLLSLTVDSAIDGKSFYITVNDESYAQDYAIILNSVAHNNVLSLDYGAGSNMQIVYATPSLGEYAAVYLLVALLLVLAAAIVFSVVRYKKLGLVNAITLLIYALTIVIALMLIGIQLTLAGAFAIILGLALVAGSNFAVFEAVRSETKKGKTVQSAVKSGYKSRLTAILDLHLILIVVSLLLTLICAGEIQAVGFIFFIASVASYILHWFTRFMWFVTSSPSKDKFKFGGFKREVSLDD